MMEAISKEVFYGYLVNFKVFLLLFSRQLKFEKLYFEKKACLRFKNYIKQV